jgi:four helix bundle protein
MPANRARPLPHQSLRVWHRAVKLVQICCAQPPDDAELRNQATRAAKSVALNIAEGAPLAGPSRRRFFQIARASLVEVAAAYELAAEIGEEVPTAAIDEEVDAIYAMLSRLMR